MAHSHGGSKRWNSGYTNREVLSDSESRSLVQTRLLNPAQALRSHITIQRSRIESFQCCRRTAEAPATDNKNGGFPPNSQIPTRLIVSSIQPLCSTALNSAS